MDEYRAVRGGTALRVKTEERLHELLAELNERDAPWLWRGETRTVTKWQPVTKQQRLALIASFPDSNEVL